MIDFIKKLLKPEIRDRSIDIKSRASAGGVFLDVRGPLEFKAGHIDGAKNIPVEVLEQHLDEVKALEGPIFAYCRSGRRSGRATDILRSHGIDAYNVGGYEPLKKRLQ